MEHKSPVSIDEMKKIFETLTGSKFPVRITEKNGVAVLRYVRGFADPQKNILLVSEAAGSLALRILEIKDVRLLEFATGDAEWKVVAAKWLTRIGCL